MLRSSLFALLCLPLFASTALPQNKPAKPNDKFADILTKLNQSVDIDKKIENASLSDVVEFLSERHDMTITINTTSFQSADPPLDQVDRQQVRLPKLIGVRLSTVLTTLLSPFNGAYLVHADRVEIVSLATAVKTIYAEDAITTSNPQSLLERNPPVSIVFSKAPVEEAFRQLSEVSGSTVIVDSKIDDAAKRTVNGRLLNTPVESAARALALQCDLDMVVVDGVVFVTTKPNSKHLRMAEETKRKSLQPTELQKAIETMNSRQSAAVQGLDARMTEMAKQLEHMKQYLDEVRRFARPPEQGPAKK